LKICFKTSEPSRSYKSSRFTSDFVSLRSCVTRFPSELSHSSVMLLKRITATASFQPAPFTPEIVQRQAVCQRFPTVKNLLGYKRITAARNPPSRGRADICVFCFNSREFEILLLSRKGSGPAKGPAWSDRRPFQAESWPAVAGFTLSSEFNSPLPLSRPTARCILIA